jgi:putative Holliday junction resolvase
MAIDYGEKNIGLASFHVGKDPFPLKYAVLKNNSKSTFLNELEKIISDEEIDVLILGLPFLTDGKETIATKKMRELGEEIQNRFSQIDFYFQDETLSSEEAKSRMKNSAEYNYKVDQSKIDIESALIILEDFLNSAEN